MGLDMYLKRKKYIGANYDFRNVRGSIDIKIGDKEMPINFNKVSYIEEEVGYWRKANQIHRYFVENVQDGVDDCKSYYVSIRDLEYLLDLCERVVNNPKLASELLPTEAGFFFGSTDYDEYYMYDIKNTIKIIKEILKEEKILNKNGFYSDFEYQSSW